MNFKKSKTKSILAVSVVTVLLVFTSSEVLAKNIGRIVFLNGKVAVQSGKKGKWKKAKVGQVITSKMSINTGLRSKAVVKMDVGNTIRVKPATVIKFSQFSKGSYGSATTLDVKSGGVTAFVKKLRKGQRNHFRVRTPTAVAGVRGSIIDLFSNGEIGDHIAMPEHFADVYDRNGMRADIPENGAVQGQRDPSRQMRMPNELAEFDSRIMLDDPSMSPEQFEAMFDSFDASFGGSPADLEFLQMLLEDEFFNSLDVVEFELL